MPETKEIQTITTYSTAGSAIEIITQYQANELPYVQQAFLAPVDGSLEAISYGQGDLVIQMTNYPGLIDFQLDSNGNLLVIADDSNQYSIDGDGNLIYTD